MITTRALPTSSQATHGECFDCLDAPVPRGMARIRAYLVDRIKRAAIRQLHRSTHGERWMLRMYLDWLAPRIGQHLADERRHAAAFADALRRRGVDVSTGSREPDWLSRRKIMRWRRLAQRYAPHFAQGVLVPAYATGLCAEQMAMRVLMRHCATIGEAHPLYPLLSRVLADETRHVRLCADTLRRLVEPSEAASLAALLDEIRAIEAGFGVTGALAMVAAGWLQSLRPRA
ncbi:hypothetical protein DF153_10830 [Burkholderia cenocepacia]|nr:hypothetical protein DF152_01300 [Burkholderia cenocepacia]RQU25267.1 hypothetical protein DF153_10830 [Burkholderia cenocepacia]